MKLHEAIMATGKARHATAFGVGREVQRVNWGNAFKSGVTYKVFSADYPGCAVYDTLAEVEYTLLYYADSDEWQAI